MRVTVVLLWRLMHDGTCSITSDNAINMKTIGPILGFNKDQAINANTKTKSGNSVNINNGLQHINVTCSLVKMIDNINTNGKRSDVIAVLPITTTQSFNSDCQMIRALFIRSISMLRTKMGTQ